ncbi:MAG: endo-1,4-beta-xylanase [Oscillatoriophycideae cyanobacterium NC_groundwater_1537_Pr4_S-0.65um_50_18]|nr:endo-1,4-beta-xylanase [Oscillatoriophycideae cyanobacterium NC_groundwater_1537_Pr4_S-0.65um_50_18]
MFPKYIFPRRHILQFGLGALMGTIALAGAKILPLNRWAQAVESLNRTFAVDEKLPLKDRSIAKGLIYGAAGRYGDLLNTQKLADCFVQECGMLVPEWELKWFAGEQPLRPGPHQFDFTRADGMVEFAQANGLFVRGHTLVWHLSLPDWFEGIVNSQNARRFLVKHIKTVVGHYAGQMHSWDVVNEAIELNHERDDNLRKTPWLELLGSNYIDLAFRTAAEADPHALLVYNDYGLEYDRDTDESKRKAVLKLLEHLKARGTPIHALGIQSHLQGDATDFNPDRLRRFLSDVASLGLKILITELDVNDQKLPVDIEVRDRIVAGVYEDYLNVVLDEPAVIAVLTWGLSDRYTWLSQFNPRSDNAPVRSLPFDDQFNRKLAWNAMARAFDNARNR